MHWQNDEAVPYANYEALNNGTYKVMDKGWNVVEKYLVEQLGVFLAAYGISDGLTDVVELFDNEKVHAGLRNL